MRLLGVETVKSATTELRLSPVSGSKKLPPRGARVDHDDLMLGGFAVAEVTLH